MSNCTSYDCLRSLAFALDAEVAHELTLKTTSMFPWLGNFWHFHRQASWRLQTAIGPVTFPVGLAAGLDKNAQCLEFFSQLGFGFLEVGTVTPRPQAGNPRPRLWRLPEEQSLRNAMGFNNHGPQVMAANIESWRRQGRNCSVLLGINLGKNKDTSASDAPVDYRLGYQSLASLSDYIVINVSSPNTPGLRDLQSEQALSEILSELRQVRGAMPRPLFIKISPDISVDALEPLVGLAQREKLAGLIATNTTIMPELGSGGVSGKLLAQKSTAIRNRLLEMSLGTGLEIIGVGGVSSFDDLWTFWRNGGRLMQIYSSFIYQGPPLLQQLARGLEKALLQTGSTSLAQMLADWRHLPEKIKLD